MLLYPVLLVYPQGLIYRAFFFERYRLLPHPEVLIVMSAVAFSFAHIIFRNPIAVSFTLVGGILFPWRHAHTGSLFTCAFEHALYGCWMSTIGLGEFSYKGAHRRIPRRVVQRKSSQCSMIPHRSFLMRRPLHGVFMMQPTEDRLRPDFISDRWAIDTRSLRTVICVNRPKKNCSSSACSNHDLLSRNVYAGSTGAPAQTLASRKFNVFIDLLIRQVYLWCFGNNQGKFAPLWPRPLCPQDHTSHTEKNQLTNRRSSSRRLFL
jgi:Type II CAAX prenyl endopeptidase Rce1-like